MLTWSISGGRQRVSRVSLRCSSCESERLRAPLAVAGCLSSPRLAPLLTARSMIWFWFGVVFVNCGNFYVSYPGAPFFPYSLFLSPPSQTPPTADASAAGPLLGPGAGATCIHVIVVEGFEIDSFQACIECVFPRLNIVFFVSFCLQSSSMKASKGLQKALEDLEEERKARQQASEEVFKLEGDVARLQAEEKRVKVRPCVEMPQHVGTDQANRVSGHETLAFGERKGKMSV